MSSPIPLPIKLKPSNLRPIAYRILSKKHGLHVKSDALEVLTEYIGSTYGLQWKSPESLKFIEEVGKRWKSTFQGNKNLFVDGENLKLIISEINQKENVSSQAQAPPVQGKLASVLGISDSVAGNMATIVDEEEETPSIPHLKLEEYFTISDLKELPIVHYNHAKKKYEPYLPAQNSKSTDSLTKRLLLDFEVQDRLAIHLSRYYQLYHRLLRNEAFHFTSMVNPTASSYFNELELLDAAGKLTKLQTMNEEIRQVMPIKNLLGRHGQQFIVFGMLGSNKEGNYTLQDSTGSVVLDLEKAFPDESFFYFEGCYVICDGIYTNFGAKSRFVVNLIYHPKAETRQDFFKNFGHLDFLHPTLEFKPAQILEAYESVCQRMIGDSLDEIRPQNLDKIVFLGCNIHLDLLQTLDYLKRLFERLSENADDLPMAIVFPGSFLETPFEASPISALGDNSLMQYKGLFDSLAVVLDQFPLLCEKTRFIFTAGLNDPWGALVYRGSQTSSLPYNRLPSMFFTRLGRVVKHLRVVTNPFKMSYLGKDITLLNDEVYDRMLRSDIPLDYYQEKAQLIKEALTDTSEAAPSVVEVEDEERQVTASLYSDISSIGNLRITSLAKSSLRMTDGKARRREVAKLVNTLVHQLHLTPFSVSSRPIVWKYEPLLNMTPLPNTLVLFDSSIDFFDQTVAGVKVVNVGLFLANDSKSVSYVEYRPASGSVELKKLYKLY